MYEDVREVLFTKEQIQDRVAQMGSQITEHYADSKQLVAISILKGASIFMSDLVRAIELPLEMDFMAVSSYGSEAKTSGVVQITKDLQTPIEGKDVLIVEDILDSGLTLDYLMRVLSNRNPASLEIATLLYKRGKQKVDLACSFVGFDCPDEFIVGYGLDYAERYRNLPCVGVLKPEVYQ